MDAINCRVPASDGRAQGAVEGVDRAVPFGGGDDALPIHYDLDGGLGEQRLPLVGDDPVGLEFEVRLAPARRVAEQQLQGAVGHLEVVALVLEPLERVEY